MRPQTIARLATVITGMSMLTGTAVAKELDLSVWTQFSPPAQEDAIGFDALLEELVELEHDLRVLERMSATGMSRDSRAAKQ